MSDMAKQARAAMKAKAKSLTTADPHQKVDSSTWTPPEPINAGVKTGLRPLSRRAFKSGGKVQVGKSKTNLGKATRGGNKPITPDTMANKDVKAANMDRPGIKHIGGMKKGGAACGPRGKYATKGGVKGITPQEYRETEKMTPDQKMMMMRGEAYDVRPEDADRMRRSMEQQDRYNRYQGEPSPPAGMEYGVGESRPTEMRKSGGRAKKLFGGYSTTEGSPVGGPAAALSRKKGGRAKKMLGGPLMQPDAMIGAVGTGGGTIPTAPGQQGGVDPNDPRFKMVSPQAMNFGVGAKGTPYKKGGTVKHPDEAMDKALIKKMVKPSARTGKNNGGGSLISPEESHGIRADVAGTFRQAKREAGGDDVYGSDEKFNQYMKNVDRIDNFKREHGQVDLKRGGKVKRMNRASGGATKGKSNIRINIMTAPPAGGGQMLTPRLGPTPPPGSMPGRPVPIPAPGGGALPTPMPMPVPIPMGGAPMAPPAGGAAPMARKSGGRIAKVAKSYKDMEAGAGSGEGRLQKTDIAKRLPKPKEDGVIGTTNLGYPNKVPGATGGRTAHKAGGRTYRSYKDMDAGAGSGMGRLEKTEIQARKG